MTSCPGCGLANYEGICAVCSGDEVRARDEGLPYPWPEEEIIDCFRVPPHIMGHPPEPKSRKQAARVRLAYIDSMGLDPFSFNDPDVEEVLVEDRLRALGLK